MSETEKPTKGVYIGVPTHNYYGFIRVGDVKRERIPVESYRREKRRSPKSKRRRR